VRIGPRHLAAFVGGAALAIAFGVWAQAGYPSRPTFQNFKVGASSLFTTANNGRASFGGVVPSIGYDETDQAADERAWNIQLDGKVFVINACPNSLAGCARALELIRGTGATITGAEINDVDIYPECTVINTATGTGWSSMPTLSGVACRVGRVVTVTISANATGTSNSNNTNFTNALPASFRPSSFTCAGKIGGIDNGVANPNVAIAIETNGTIAFSLLSSDCSSLGVNWSAAGNKQIQRGSFSYVK
jgi:uncharacterized repeat protein (TIGR01451 family)